MLEGLRKLGEARQETGKATLYPSPQQDSSLKQAEAGEEKKYIWSSLRF